MKANTIITNIGTLLTPKEHTGLLRGKDMDAIDTYHQAFVAIKDGCILDFGTHDYREYLEKDTVIFDALSRLVTPGFIDAHTHVVHAGSREHEFEMKRRGVPYMDILAAGGGIISTVSATRKSSFEDLCDQSERSLDTLLSYGVTTVEGKSGYGLDRETELKQLRVMKTLNQNHPIDIVPTFMGAHALPQEYKHDTQGYLELVVSLLSEIKEENLAEFVDVFCEEGAFDVKESEYVLNAAKKEGFKLKIHADEIHSLGGVPLAARLGATSADHLMAIDPTGIEALKHHDVVATILPSTSFNLMKPYAPVRKMLDNDVAIALSSDYNPGSAPSENYLFVLNLAALHLKMTPHEILNAATYNAAYAVNRQNTIGTIKKGYQADLVVFDADNWPYVLYHYAVNHVSDVFKKGIHVVKDKQLNRR